LGLPDVQAGQALELIDGQGNTTLPVVLSGDFNFDANVHYGPAVYSILTSQGRFTDTWSVARPNSPWQSGSDSTPVEHPAEIGSAQAAVYLDVLDFVAVWVQTDSRGTSGIAPV
jgi:hypothetical protein